MLSKRWGKKTRIDGLPFSFSQDILPRNHFRLQREPRMLSHTDIWNAIDNLAKKNGLSASGLAKKAGLSSTLFNPSKRVSAKRKRWPSTESIAAILQATATSLDDFLALANPNSPQQTKIPFLSTKDVRGGDVFDEETGEPNRAKWDQMLLPVASDPAAFALEVAGKSLEPLFSDGTILIISPKEKPRRMDIVALRTRSGDLIVRKLGREGGQKIELLGETADAPPVTYARQDVLWMHRVLWASL